MDLKNFTENFDLLVDTPNGIPKLREMILQLAVRGKFVPQDPDDEPASVLLKRIAAERERLIAEGKIKKPKPIPPIEPDEIPYELPERWEWVRLTEIFYSISPGRRKVKTKDLKESGKCPVVDQGQSRVAGYVDDMEKLIAIPGPVIVFGDHTRAVKYVDFDFVAGADGTKILRPVLLNECYFFWVMRNYHLDDRGYSRHYKVLREELFALPPLAEQKRIVAKVDELMAICDELEERQKKRDEIRVGMNAACLHDLTSAEPKKSKKGWTRIRKNFDLLYDTPENVTALRQSILQLAVMGRLVSQDAMDEPASVLLEKIATEKKRLIAEGKIKKTKLLPPIKPHVMPYGLPEGWEWTRMNEVSIAVEYGTSHRASGSNQGVPVLRMNNVQGGKITLDNLKYVPKGIDDLPRLLLDADDIIFNRTNSYELVGKAGIFKGQSQKYTFASYLIRVKLHDRWIVPDYVNTCLNARYFRVTQIEPAVTQQCGQANFSGGKLKNALLPVPPTAQQHRIVAKVDELMALCDELESKLQRSRSEGEKLMDAVVNQITMAQHEGSVHPSPVNDSKKKRGETGSRIVNDKPRVSIDDLETEEVMAAFRKVCRGLGAMTREGLLKEVAIIFGYQRLGSTIQERLKGHLRAAIRRKIIGTKGKEVWLETRTMDDYDRAVLVGFLSSIMHWQKEYDRKEVIRALANYLGFRRLTEGVQAPIKSAINSAIRQGNIVGSGSTIRRIL